jgi:ABC-type branched-subunit amino acid transport system ATPase component
MSALECIGVSKAFDGVPAVEAVDLQVSAGEIVGVIGPNGSGKSTLLSMMSGIYRPDAGKIVLDGVPIQQTRSHSFRRLGVARTFQNARVFDDLTVTENVIVGLHSQFVERRLAEWGWPSGVLGLGAGRRRENAARELCERFLDRVGLAAVADLKAGGCSYGQRKRIELARAMIGEPPVLLLDEPMAGIPVDGIDELVELMIRPASVAGAAIVIVEHRMELILELCSRLVVLSAGRKIADGRPQDVIEVEEVRSAYLGE